MIMTGAPHAGMREAVKAAAEMPRLPTGKLYKRLLRVAYWTKRKV